MTPTLEAASPNSPGSTRVGIKDPGRAHYDLGRRTAVERDRRATDVRRVVGRQNDGLDVVSWPSRPIGVARRPSA
jgi:hypothetical protein